MKNHLVLFDTAKLAQEKGFDIPCKEHCFVGNTDKIVYEKSVHCIDWGNRDLSKAIQKYSRPSQSLLQKWLREVHNIRVFVTQKVSGDFGFEIFVPNKADSAGTPFNRISFFTLHFTSYEEALEVGLVEGLKLINL